MAPALVLSPSDSEVYRKQLAPLNASKLHVTKTLSPSQTARPEDLAFGKHTTDHMLQVEWTSAHGWSRPRIIPFEHIALDPTACVFHYGFECFEGMKAYKDTKGRLRLFRPRMNLDRLNRSSARIALPTFESGELLKLIAEFVELEQRFIPDKPGYSLYLRPVIIGTNGGLGVSAPTSALLYMVASPVGAYYSHGFKAISLEAANSSKATRAWPGGAGSHKIGGNYAPCIAPEASARTRGYSQILWLFGEDDSITEAGTMNLFVVLRNHRTDTLELVTPPLDGMILPGVTRDCVLSLARERLQTKGWLVRERRITMEELATASEAGELVEVFGTGTAAIVSPIRTIKWHDRTLECGLAAGQDAGDLTCLMKEWIEARQYGKEEHEWSTLIDSIKR